MIQREEREGIKREGGEHEKEREGEREREREENEGERMRAREKETERVNGVITEISY